MTVATVLPIASTPWVLLFRVGAPPMVLGGQASSTASPMRTKPAVLMTVTAPAIVLGHIRNLAGALLAETEPMTCEFSMITVAPGRAAIDPLTVELVMHRLVFLATVILPLTVVLLMVRVQVNKGTVAWAVAVAVWSKVSIPVTDADPRTCAP